MHGIRSGNSTWPIQTKGRLQVKSKSNCKLRASVLGLLRLLSGERVKFGQAGEERSITLAANDAIILRYKFGTTEREKKRCATP